MSLGTNLGDRLHNLRRAVAALELEGVATVGSISPVYETPPWGMTEQPQFLNLCLSARTDKEPQALLHQLKKLERALGRTPGERWGPRVIDIDLLTYGDLVLEVDNLVLPHPGIPERAFVLAPLADIAAGWVHPRTGKRVAQMLQEQDLTGLQQLPLPLYWGRRTSVMGILNVTPDSFSGDGLIAADETIERAVRQAEAFVRSGADILDIGGESTRPGSQPVSAAEELGRVLPVIRAVRAAVKVPISVDTYRAEVAEAALEAGADWVNDVWGLQMDARMGAVVAQAGCPVVLMHNRSRPKNVEQEQRLGGRYVGIEYQDLIDDIMREMSALTADAVAQGIRHDQIILDPGIGFGKTVSQNVRLLDELSAFKELGYPLLIGPSRKSFIGYTLDLPPDQRVEGTSATIAIGIDRGADIVRVHDVEAMVRVTRMTDRIVRRNADAWYVEPQRAGRVAWSVMPA